ncbi:MAG TPA: LptA/OstA family protein [Steroidobacter sp.]|nr:LptA/OstA family protein [Steroidobacter sp.]
MAPTNLASFIAVVSLGASLACLAAELAQTTTPQAKPAQAEGVLADRTLDWSADVLNSDFRSDTLDLAGNVRVQQGAMSIEAQAATGTDFRSNNSRWTFKGDVRIRTAQADLQANSASASFVNGQIADARVEGSPAQFEQRGDASEPRVRGRADVIDYDFTSGVVRLENEVWFSNGKDEFRGDVVIYNLREERVQINPGGRDGRVRGVIRPRETSPNTPPADAKTPRKDEKGA